MKQFIITALTIFVAAGLTDIIWVYYIRRISQGRAFSAAMFATTTWLLGAYVVIEYVKDPMLLIPAAVGGLLGTYFAIRYDVRERNRKK